MFSEMIPFCFLNLRPLHCHQCSLQQCSCPPPQCRSHMVSRKANKCLISATRAGRTKLSPKQQGLGWMVKKKQWLGSRRLSCAGSHHSAKDCLQTGVEALSDQLVSQPTVKHSFRRCQGVAEIPREAPITFPARIASVPQRSPGDASIW